nr:hypothetical protein [Enhydrobacter sp. 8BJ]
MSCHEKMIISLKLNQAQGEIEELSAVENCEDISNEKGISDLELPSIYLSSDFSVHESEIHSDFSFPAHRVMQFLTRNLTYKLKLRTANSLKLGKSRLISGDE